MNLRLLAAAYGSLLDLDVLDQSLVTDTSMESDWQPQTSSDDVPAQEVQQEPQAEPAQQDQPDGPALQARRPKPAAADPRVYQTRAWSRAHPSPQREYEQSADQAQNEQPVEYADFEDVEVEGTEQPQGEGTTSTAVVPRKRGSRARRGGAKRRKT